MRSAHLFSVSCLALLIACDDKSDDTGTDDVNTDTAEDVTDTTTDFSCEAPASSVCSEELGFCGNLKVPTDFTGTPRSLAIALYTSIPPAGPPSATLAEIEGPDLIPGSCYTVEVSPMLEQGEYYIWANLYMEGGGSWVPVNDVDYTANSAAPVMMVSSGMVFEDLTLGLASGW
ncbi:MAG: hypothetical protein P8R54_26330 [Myxococcota bacterium]|nr:hypothetical protein [Myxococcota bacterium]